MFAVQAKMEECMYARSLKAMESMESSRSISFWRSSFMVMTWTLAIHAYAGNHECRSSQVPTKPNPTLARLDEYWSRKRQNICMIISHYLLLASIRYSIEIMSNHSLLLAEASYVLNLTTINILAISLTNIDGMIALDMCLQDFLVVGVGKYLISIDVNHAGQLAPPGGFNADNPLECRVEAPVQGVFVAGQHEEEVTELAVSLSGPVRVASASKDGTVSLISQSFLSRRSCNDLHVV